MCVGCGRFLSGRGVAVDELEALRWTEAAAIQGHAEAMLNLGDMYAAGLGDGGLHQSSLSPSPSSSSSSSSSSAAQRDAEVAACYRRAASAGSGAAASRLAALHGQGRLAELGPGLGGVSAEEKALWAVLLAAEAGDVAAMFQAATLHLNGAHGCPRDDAQVFAGSAAKHFKTAAPTRCPRGLAPGLFYSSLSHTNTLPLILLHHRAHI